MKLVGRIVNGRIRYKCRSEDDEAPHHIGPCGHQRSDDHEQPMVLLVSYETVVVSPELAVVHHELHLPPLLPQVELVLQFIIIIERKPLEFLFNVALHLSYT